MIPRLSCVIALATTSLIAPAAAAEELARYDALLGKVPQDSLCWDYITNASIAAPENNGQAVVLGPTSTPGYSYWAQSLVPFSFNDGASVSASVQVTSSSSYASFPYRRSGYYLQLVDRLGRFAMLGIASDGVLLATADQNWSDQSVAFNSTGAFHEYRLAFAGDVATVTIDGNQVLSAAVGRGSGPSSSVAFGDMSVLASSLTQTAWIKVEGVSDCSAGDLDCSGVVDGADLGILLGAWNTTACAADLDHDGNVDGADLGILLGNWG